MTTQIYYMLQYLYYTDLIFFSTYSQNLEIKKVFQKYLQYY